MEENKKDHIDMASEPLFDPNIDEEGDVAVLSESRILDEIDFSFVGPKSEEEALARIADAERGIANGEVISHEDVMKATFDKLSNYGCQVVR